MAAVVDPTLDRCPLCGRQPVDADWYGPPGFLVNCSSCRYYTITQDLVVELAGPLSLPDRQLLRRLSACLREAGEDDERELTVSSWRRLAAGG